MSPEAWSGVRQLILLRTKRKAAEAALNSFMLAGGGGESEQIKQEPAPVSTLVLNCFVDVIGQQVYLPPPPHCIAYFSNIMLLFAGVLPERDERRAGGVLSRTRVDAGQQLVLRVHFCTLSLGSIRAAG